MIREAIDNIRQEVARLKPTPSSSKQLIPWRVAVSTTVLIALMLGIGNQHFTRSQKPYSLDAQSESSVELVEAPIVQGIIGEPDVHRQLNNNNAGGKSDSPRPNPDDVSIRKENILDFETILSGIKHHDELIRSGEGNYTLTIQQPGINGDKRKYKYDLVFDSRLIRMEYERSISQQNVSFPKRTIVATPNGVWEIGYHKTLKTLYTFDTNTHLGPLYEWSNPRRWLRISNDEDIPTYLRKHNFRIETLENLDNIVCYVLKKENTSENNYERFWIAPEQGFRYLKRETLRPVKVDFIDGSLKKGTPYLMRITASYKQYGETWFPKKCQSEHFWIDSNGKRHANGVWTLEIKDLKVNHNILPKVFTVDIPDDAIIRVNNRELSKTEFLKEYKQE